MTKWSERSEGGNSFDVAQSNGTQPATFISIWNEYILALVLLSSSHLRTLPLGIAVLQFVQFYEVDFGALFAGLVIVMLPTLICYIVLQDQITKGITVGAVKG